MYNQRREDHDNMTMNFTPNDPYTYHSNMMQRRSPHLMSIQMNSNNNEDASTQLLRRKRKVKSLLVLSGVAFLAVICLDGVVQFTFFDDSIGDTMRHQHRAVVPSEAAMMGRHLTEDQVPIITPSQESSPIMNTMTSGLDIINASPFHRLPLLPKHALQHRQRRELMTAQKPLPPHLRHDYNQENMYNAGPELRRRMYPALNSDTGTIVDARMHRRQSGQRKSSQDQRKSRRNQQQEERRIQQQEETHLYETGALYQGYGTHYLDLYIGSPPQRQTVIVDTGSSITAFPCEGCADCGSSDGGKLRWHLDGVFERGASESYRESGCGGYGGGGDNAGTCGIGICTSKEDEDQKYCRLAVAYAEGSTWTAVEGSDVVYPSGPHEFALNEEEEREENGVGVGMADFGSEKKFEWDEFRLGFGCQTKVTGLFQTQLEDGIMGMDNRKGAFWLQLRDHYHNMGYVHDPADPFDPSQFSLCYDRQPMSSNLEAGVGSGSLTIGGSDPLLHGTPMVFAENVTPIEGWYTVKIKGMFLRSHGGTLADPYSDSNEVKYIRVDADEKDLNGATQDGTGPIVDSGTTDTYLSASLKEPFNEAWKKAIGPDAEYSNEAVHLTPEQVHALPTVLLVLRGHISNAQHSSSEDNVPVGMVGHPNHASMLQLNPDDKTLNSISPNDIIVAIPPEHYMEESSKEKGRYTSRIYFSERMGDRSVLGSNFIMGHEVLFDNTAGRLGFAESHCDYERYIVEKGEMLKQALMEKGEGQVQAQQEMNVQQVASEVAAALVEGQQQQQQVAVDIPAEVPAAPVQVEQAPAANQAQQQVVPAAPDAQQAAANQVGLDALATGIVQGNNAPQENVPEGAAPVQPDVALGDEGSSLTASGWSRKTQEVGGLRQEIRIPG